MIGMHISFMTTAQVVNRKWLRGSAVLIQFMDGPTLHHVLPGHLDNRLTELR